jgi:hypothetical protein
VSAGGEPAPTLLFLLARTSRFPLRAEDGCVPRLQAAANGFGHARGRWPRRPDELTENQTFLRSCAARCRTGAPCLWKFACSARRTRPSCSSRPVRVCTDSALALRIARSGAAFSRRGVAVEPRPLLSATSRPGLCVCLTFEVRRGPAVGRQARAGENVRVPPDRAWWPAVGPRLDRGVRPRSSG